MRVKLPSSLSKPNYHLTTSSSSSLPSCRSSTKPFRRTITLHINNLAHNLSSSSLSSSSLCIRTFSSSPQARSQPRNRILPSTRRPSDFHTLLQSTSSSNTLLLALFRTSSCQSCAQITPLLESVILARPCPSPGDSSTFSGGIAFTEVELDSPDREEDTGGKGWSAMYDVGVEYGVRSVPTLIGFGGRRAERITERVADEKDLKDRRWVEEWLDEVMRRGDPSPGSVVGGGQGGWLGKLFGGGG